MYPSREKGAVQRPVNRTSSQTEGMYARPQREKFKQKLLTHPIIQHPVREFLLFYQAGLKREMKRKINVIFCGLNGYRKYFV